MTAITETNNFLGHFVYSWAQRLIHFGLLHHIALPFLVCRPTSLYLHPFALFVSYNFKLSTILHTKLVYTSMYVYTGSLASCLHLQRFVCILRPFFSVLFDVVASRWVNSLCNWHAFTLIQCSTIYQQLCLSSSLCCWYCLLSILVWLLLVLGISKARPQNNWIQWNVQSELVCTSIEFRVWFSESLSIVYLFFTHFLLPDNHNSFITINYFITTFQFGRYSYKYFKW